MEAEPTTTQGLPVVCPPCGAPIDPLRARHIAVVRGRVVSFCSADCRDRADEPPPPPAREPSGDLEVVPRRSRRFAVLAALSPAVVAAGVFLGVRVRINDHPATAALQQKPTVASPAAVVEPEPVYGPEAPPKDFFVEGDRWYHPLAGPVRRLPERPTRRFGVGRDHDSPDSCRNGHCGVDVGEIKGEAVLASHDGVVARVVREEGPDRGGRYVRLLHNGGHIITQYMHLDTVAADLKPGLHVRAGEVIGTVGDSGTVHSGPHLHFTVATRDSEDAPEKYIDPEPLLTLWPLSPR